MALCYKTIFPNNFDILLCLLANQSVGRLSCPLFFPRIRLALSLAIILLHFCFFHFFKWLFFPEIHFTKLDCYKKNVVLQIQIFSTALYTSLILNFKKAYHLGECVAFNQTWQVRKDPCSFQIEICCTNLKVTFSMELFLLIALVAESRCAQLASRAAFIALVSGTEKTSFLSTKLVIWRGVLIFPFRGVAEKEPTVHFF